MPWTCSETPQTHTHIRVHTCIHDTHTRMHPRAFSIFSLGCRNAPAHPHTTTLHDFLTHIQTRTHTHAHRPPLYSSLPGDRKPFSGDMANATADDAALLAHFLAQAQTPATSTPGMAPAAPTPGPGLGSSAATGSGASPQLRKRVAAGPHGGQRSAPSSRSGSPAFSVRSRMASASAAAAAAAAEDPEGEYVEKAGRTPARVATTMSKATAASTM